LCAACLQLAVLFLTPSFFLRKRLNIELYRDAPEGTQPLLSDTGFINTELFLERLKHFTKPVKPIEKDPALPILDNHISLYFGRNDFLQGIFYYTAVYSSILKSHDATT
jgi:hypothetical protein